MLFLAFSAIAQTVLGVPSILIYIHAFMAHAGLLQWPLRPSGWPTWKPATGFQFTLVQCSAKWSGLQPTNKDNSSERGAKWVTKLPSSTWPGFVFHHFSTIHSHAFLLQGSSQLGPLLQPLENWQMVLFAFRTNLAMSNKSNPMTGRTRALDRMLPSQLVSLSCDSMNISPLICERQVWDGSAGTCANILLP